LSCGVAMRPSEKSDRRCNIRMFSGYYYIAMTNQLFEQSRIFEARAIQTVREQDNWKLDWAFCNRGVLHSMGCNRARHNKRPVAFKLSLHPLPTFGGCIDLFCSGKIRASILTAARRGIPEVNHKLAMRFGIGRTGGRTRWVRPVVRQPTNAKMTRGTREFRKTNLLCGDGLEGGNMRDQNQSPNDEPSIHTFASVKPPFS